MEMTHYGQVARSLISKARQDRYLAFVLRLILGATFILAGTGKLPHMWELFIGMSDVLEILQTPYFLRQFVQLQIQWLPWIEIVVGTALVIGWPVRLAALASALMTTAFFVFNSARLVLPITEWCNCFGVTLHISLPVAQALDVVLLLMAVSILFHRQGNWGPVTWLLRRR